MMIALKEKGVTKSIHMMCVRDTQKYSALNKKFISLTCISPKIGRWVWCCFPPQGHSRSEAGRSAFSSCIASSLSPKLFQLLLFPINGEGQ